MAYNRNKTLAKAQKLLQKGKIEEAIREYMEVVENDPSDVRTLLKIGDLQAKLGDIDSATETYQKVGEHYAKDGFFLKAVAVFKQILKLDPGLIRIYIRLAELYQYLGLNSEAMKQYQVVARHYETQGLKKESLDILKKMSELEPDNVASKVKLAELYAKEGHLQESSEQFLNAASELRRRNNLQDLARVYEKMEIFGLLDANLQLQLVEVYLGISEPKRSLAKLQILFQNDPKNISVLELLARSFTDLAQSDKARSVYSELINIVTEKGLLEFRDKYVAKLRSLSVTSSLESMLATDVPSVPAAPDPTATISASAVMPEPSKVAGKPAEKLLEEVEVFIQYGLLEKACDTLSQAVISMPASEPIRKKLVEAFLRKGDTKKLISALTQSLHVAEGLQLTDAMNAIKTQIVGLTAGGGKAETPIPERQVVASGLDLSELEIVDDDDSNTSSKSQLTSVVAIEDVDSEIQESLDLGDDPAVEASVAEALLEPGSEDLFDVSFRDMEAPPAAEGLPPEVANVSLEEPIVSVEVPKRRGPKLVIDEEAPGFERDSSGEGETIDLNVQPFSLDSIPGAEPVAEVEVELEGPVVETISATGDGFTAEMEEAEFFLKQGLLDEAREVYEQILSQDANFKPAQQKITEMTDVLPPSATAQASAKTPETIAEPSSPPPSRPTQRVLAEKEKDSFFDLSAELQEEIQDLEEELSKPKAQDKEDYLSPEEVISEFKKGVARTVAKDDYATHYNLGIAYKEMGLLNEAINEFEIAGAESSRVADCASMIGLCLMGKRDYASAVGVYRKALAQVSPQSSEALGLSYELAEAYIGHGNLHEAYKLFARVCDVDPTFRDSRRRAKELEVDLGSSAPLPTAAEKRTLDDKSVVKIPAKKNKISYI